MKRLPDLAYHASLLGIGFIAAVIINNGEIDFFKNLGAAFAFWALGALVNRFGNRTAGIIVAILFAYFAYIGRG